MTEKELGCFVPPVMFEPLPPVTMKRLNAIKEAKTDEQRTLAIAQLVALHAIYERRLCSCGKPGKLRIDPYKQDIEGRTVWTVMCDECCHQACEDI